MLITLSLMLSQKETQPKHTLKVEPDWLQFEVMTGGRRNLTENGKSLRNHFLSFTEKELSARLSAQNELWNGHVLFNCYQTLPQCRTISEEQNRVRVFLLML